MPTWETQGRHRYYRDADLLFFELHGLFSIDDANCLHAVADLIEQDHGYVLCTFDAADGMTMSPEARRATGDRSRSRETRGATAIVGASFTIRTVALLITNAARLFGKPVPPIYFCSSIDDATQWLDTQRPLLRAAAAVHPGP